MKNVRFQGRYGRIGEIELHQTIGNFISFHIVYDRLLWVKYYPRYFISIFPNPPVAQFGGCVALLCDNATGCPPLSHSTVCTV